MCIPQRARNKFCNHCVMPIGLFKCCGKVPRSEVRLGKVTLKCQIKVKESPTCWLLHGRREIFLIAPNTHLCILVDRSKSIW
jgi:hypothetical protein